MPRFRSAGRETVGDGPHSASREAATSARAGRSAASCPGVEIRFRGRVQGVGFRPTVWKVAREMGLAGRVLNDGEGVLVTLARAADRAGDFVERVRGACPPLALIESVECREVRTVPVEGFSISESASGPMATEITPDAATCPDCLAEIRDPATRRHGYAFTNCTHCGPRLAIVTGAPYDRERTTMAGFPLCAECRSEFEDPADRRFHAQPIACPACGPRIAVEADGRVVALRGADDLGRQAAAWLRSGRILAVKGLGGYQFACRAADETAVARLRVRKRRPGKPFALMARDLEVVRRFAVVTPEEAELLAGPAAPILLLPRLDPGLPDALAPGLGDLGFMLPNTPLHHLLLADFDEPVVMTSGNLSTEPQIIDDAEASERLAGVADVFVRHDRPIAVRVDDSVVRTIGGRPSAIRRGRGFAPASLRLPDGFGGAKAVTAMGGDLKNAPCLLRPNRALLLQHVGDLEEPRTLDDCEALIRHSAELHGHRPEAVAVDLHPDHHATRLGRRIAREAGLPVVAVQHHHAHAASAMVENGIDPREGPILALVVDGTGLGEDGTVWGCELLAADYRGFERLGTLLPMALPGGDAAAREPWRCLVAAVLRSIGWDVFLARYGTLAVVERLRGRPVAAVAAMIRGGVNAPMASSAGRLFDAVGAALGVVTDAVAYEAEAAMRLEALAARAPAATPPYPFAIETVPDMGLPALSPAPMWRRLFDDLAGGMPASQVAARFHVGFAAGLAGLVRSVAPDGLGGERRILLSGGVAQNRVFTEHLIACLEADGFRVLTHSAVPANDGGLALGQAAVAAARLRS